jgi:hypothetical protein
MLAPQVQVNAAVIGHVMRPALAPQSLDVEAGHNGIGLQFDLRCEFRFWHDRLLLLVWAFSVCIGIDCGTGT